MIFTLEALEAKHGDALLLHYEKKKGEKISRELIVIDGGPGGVFDKSLRRRLEQIREKRNPPEPLSIRLVMVSHIDDDHINGILDLINLLIEQGDDNPHRLCDIQTLWYNSFDEILGNNQTEVLAAALSSAVKLAAAGDETFLLNLFSHSGAAAVAASVGQGRELRDNAEALGLWRNEPVGKLVALPGKKKTPYPIDGKLEFRVLAPTKARLENLQEDWDKELIKILEKKKKNPAEATALAARFIDDSVYNLSSIVVIAELEGKTMLLTGDALADDILKGLKQTGLLKDGETLHVDLLKMPHHGSIKNITEEFLRSVTADCYVFSANGKHKHPSRETLEMLAEVRGGDAYKVYLTNHVAHADEFYKEDRNKAGRNYEVITRQDPELSLFIDLGEPYRD
ncbi:MAG TPA: hypothetical protein VF721_24020 [Pyrinomonadaceae bacterium]